MCRSWNIGQHSLALRYHSLNIYRIWLPMLSISIGGRHAHDSWTISVMIHSKISWWKNLLAIIIKAVIYFMTLNCSIKCVTSPNTATVFFKSNAHLRYICKIGPTFYLTHLIVSLLSVVITSPGFFPETLCF